MATQIFQWDFNILNYTDIHSHSRGLLLLLIFFSLLIFITTFFLCVHWISAQYFPPTAAGATVHATPAPSPGLDPRTINSLPIILHAKNNGEHGRNVEETECSICLGVFEDEEMVKILPRCNHAYHSRCVDKWLGSRSSCPLCRACLIPITSP